MERSKEPKLFEFQKYGMQEPATEVVPFSRKFPHLKDHSKTEAVYHPGENKTYINAEMPSAEHDIAENHERIHHFQRELGRRNPVQYSNFISTIASALHPDDIKKLGVYAQSGRNNAMTRDEVYSELLPHLYSMSKSPWHRENYKKQFGGTDADLDRLSGVWDVISGSLGLNKSAPVAKQEKPEPSLAQQIKSVKAKYVPPREPTFKEQIKAIKTKYKEKIKKSASMAVAKGLQPSTEAWEAAAAQQLGLPLDQATADKLAKQAEIEWNNSVANSFRSLAQPVEKIQKTDWGSRGRVDQDDESRLTEEEKRIRMIQVNPEALKD